MSHSNEYPLIFEIARREGSTNNKIDKIKEQALLETDPQTSMSLINGIVSFYSQAENYHGDKSNINFSIIKSRDDIGVMKLQTQDVELTCTEGYYTGNLRIYHFSILENKSLTVFLPPRESIVAIQYRNTIFYCNNYGTFFDKNISNHSHTYYVPLTTRELTEIRKDVYSPVNYDIKVLPKNFQLKNLNSRNPFKSNYEASIEQEEARKEGMQLLIKDLIEYKSQSEDNSKGDGRNGKGSGSGATATEMAENADFMRRAPSVPTHPVPIAKKTFMKEDSNPIDRQLEERIQRLKDTPNPVGHFDQSSTKKPEAGVSTLDLNIDINKIVKKVLFQEPSEKKPENSISEINAGLSTISITPSANLNAATSRLSVEPHRQTSQRNKSYDRAMTKASRPSSNSSNTKSKVLEQKNALPPLPPSNKTNNRKNQPPNETAL